MDNHKFLNFFFSSQKEKFILNTSCITYVNTTGQPITAEVGADF